MNGLKDAVGKISGDRFTLLATATDSAGATPTPEVPNLIVGTGTVTLDTTTGGIVQTDTLLHDEENMAYVSLDKGTQAFNEKAQALKSLSIIMVAMGDSMTLVPLPDGQTPLSIYRISPEDSSFSPSAELGILISDDSLSHNLYWWNELMGKWSAVDAETDNDDGYLKGDLTKSGYYMMTYPAGSVTESTAEPTILPEPTATTVPTASPTPTQSPVGILVVMAGCAACALLKKR